MNNELAQLRAQIIEEGKSIVRVFRKLKRDNSGVELKALNEIVEKISVIIQQLKIVDELIKK